MKIYYVSDIHNDIDHSNFLTAFKGDLDAVLVIAGDINSRGRTVDDLVEVSSRWKHVVAVLGNHDWYGLKMGHSHYKFDNTLLPNNLHILGVDPTLKDTDKYPNYIVLDDTLFVGQTLWHQIEDTSHWARYMNDSTCIGSVVRGSYRNNVSPDKIITRHLISCDIIDNLAKFTGVSKKVLITHHALNDKSLDPKFANRTQSNRYYSCNKPKLTRGYDVHIHGHIHIPQHYTDNACLTVANPRGYIGYESIAQKADLRSLDIWV